MSEPKTPKLTVDCVLRDAQGRILLIRRKHPPFQGQYALPGGFVDIGETVEQACLREVREEAGISLNQSELDMVGVYSAPDRDPRGHTVSVAFKANIPDDAKPKAGDDAATADLIEYGPGLDIAFDHHQIIQTALKMW